MNRATNTGFANWWFTVDRVALLCMLALAAIGLMLAFAASPAITGAPLTAGDFRYTARQVTFTGIAIVILCGTSLPQPAPDPPAGGGDLCRLADRLLPGAVRRHRCAGRAPRIESGPVRACSRRNSSSPASPSWPRPCWPTASRWHCREPVVTFLLLVPALLILIRQPDIGQTGLLLCLWGAMLFFYGMSFLWVGVGWARSARWASLAYEIVPSCASPRSAVHEPHQPRLPGRAGAEGLRAWRADRRGTGGRHHQVSHSRRAFRLHLRGRGRGIRPGAVRA